MGNREVIDPDILPQEQSPTHLSLSCNSRVKIDVNVYNNTTRNDINSWKVIQASSAHRTNIFEMVNLRNPGRDIFFPFLTVCAQVINSF